MKPMPILKTTEADCQDDAVGDAISDGGLAGKKRNRGDWEEGGKNSGDGLLLTVEDGDSTHKGEHEKGMLCRAIQNMLC